jgi:hypothetical protein
MSKKRAAADSDPDYGESTDYDNDSEATVSNHAEDNEPYYTTTNARLFAQMTSIVMLHCLTCGVEWPSDLAGQHGFGTSTGPCPRTGLHQIITGPLPLATPAPAPIAAASPTTPLQAAGSLKNRRTPNCRQMCAQDRRRCIALVKRYDTNDPPILSRGRFSPREVAMMIEQAPDCTSRTEFAT